MNIIPPKIAKSIPLLNKEPSKRTIDAKVNEESNPNGIRLEQISIKPIFYQSLPLNKRT